MHASIGKPCPHVQALPRERANPNAMASARPPLLRIKDQSTSRIFEKSSALRLNPTQPAKRVAAANWGSGSEIFAGLTTGLAAAAARAFTAVLSSASLWRQRGPLVAHSASREALATDTASFAAAMISGSGW